MPGSSQRPSSSAALVGERSTTLTAADASPGSSGANVPAGAGSSPGSESASQIAVSARSHGTDAADSKMRQSCSRFSATYAFPGSIDSCFSSVTTSVAPRRATSGHSAATSARRSGMTAWNATTAGSQPSGSSGM